VDYSAVAALPMIITIYIQQFIFKARNFQSGMLSTVFYVPRQFDNLVNCNSLIKRAQEFRYQTSVASNQCFETRKRLTDTGIIYFTRKYVQAQYFQKVIEIHVYARRRTCMPGGGRKDINYPRRHLLTKSIRMPE